MPRRYNPRTARARAKALRAEIAELRLIECRDARRAQRRVTARLQAVPGYKRLRDMHTDLEVQAAINAIELRILNGERAELGLDALGHLPPH